MKNLTIVIVGGMKGTTDVQMNILVRFHPHGVRSINGTGAEAASPQ